MPRVLAGKRSKRALSRSEHLYTQLAQPEQTFPPTRHLNPSPRLCCSLSQSRSFFPRRTLHPHLLPPQFPAFRSHQRTALRRPVAPHFSLHKLQNRTASPPFQTTPSISELFENPSPTSHAHESASSTTRSFKPLTTTAFSPASAPSLQQTLETSVFDLQSAITKLIRQRPTDPHDFCWC